MGMVPPGKVSSGSAHKCGCDQDTIYSRQIERKTYRQTYTLIYILDEKVFSIADDNTLSTGCVNASSVNMLKTIDKYLRRASYTFMNNRWTLDMTAASLLASNSVVVLRWVAVLLNLVVHPLDLI